MKVNFYNIVWEDDGENANLPTEVLLSVDENIDIESDGADVLSDEYGFLVESFNFEIK